MAKIHDFDAAWKTILEVFEVEIVELIFPEIFNQIAWELGTESLDNELKEIQKEIFDKNKSISIMEIGFIKNKIGSFFIQIIMSKIRV